MNIVFYFDVIWLPARLLILSGHDLNGLNVLNDWNEPSYFGTGTTVPQLLQVRSFSSLENFR